MLLSNKQERPVDTCNNMLDYQNNYAKWKMLDY